MKVELITRQGCHLCDDALAALRSVGVEPQLRDVDADEDLFALYDWRVPVVLIDARVVAEGRIDQEGLRKLLAGL